MNAELLAITQDLAAELRRLPCRIVPNLDGKMKELCPKCEGLLRLQAYLDKTKGEANGQKTN